MNPNNLVQISGGPDQLFPTVFGYLVSKGSSPPVFGCAPGGVAVAGKFAERAQIIPSFTAGFYAFSRPWRGGLF